MRTRSTHALLLLALLPLLAGCPAQPGANKAAGNAAAPAALPAWLNPQAQINHVIRLSTGSGEDLRQAVYLRDPASTTPLVICLLRNYEQRNEARPDLMRLLRLNEGSSLPEDVALATNTPPVKLCVAADHKTWALAAWQQAEGSELNQGHVLIIDGAELGKADAGAIQQLDPNAPADSPGLWPLGFAANGKLACAKLISLLSYNGLPAPQYDWKAGVTVYDLKARKGNPSSSPVFQGAPGGHSAAGYSVVFDPALPAQAQITYTLGGAPGQAPGELRQLTLPYFVTGERYQWEPPLAWADDGHLLFLGFQPDALGASAKANFNGLFRILCFDAKSGAVNLVEDRLTATANIVAAQGLLFYSLSSGPGGGGAWELWASSVDGLRKQLLYSTSSTLGLEPLDCLDGRRLLVHRQFFDNGSDLPVLRSELLEFNLDAAPGSVPTVDLAPLPRAKGEEENSGGSTLPEPKSDDEAPGDLMPPEDKGGAGGNDDGGGFIPDNPGDGGGGSNDGGGGGDGPPPIHLG